jgi:dCTP deaminase
MILSDREIRAALDRGAVVIDPLPAAKAWSSTAVDLTLDHELRKWISPSDESVEASVCPANPRYNFTALVTRHTETAELTDSYYDLKPNEFILGWTIERIKLPHRSRIAARVEGKSSLARLGMGIHITAPTIHAGFGYDPNSPQDKGNPIQLEIWNVGQLTIRLVAGMPICQLIFEEVHGTPEKGYQGQFTHQGPQVS